MEKVHISQQMRAECSEQPQPTMLWSRASLSRQTFQVSNAQIISIRVSAYPQPQLRKLLKHFFYTYNMDVGCRVRWVIASTMTVQHHSYPTIPYHSYSSVPSIYQKASSCTDISVKGAPISSSTAYNAAETLTLHIYIIWKLDAVSGGL